LGANRVQILDPNDPGIVLAVLDAPLVHLPADLVLLNGIGMRAISPLGCVGEDVIHLVWTEVQNPTVTVLPVTVYGTDPALGVAQASGGLAPYTFNWSTGNCLDTAGCDSVMISDFSNPVTVTALDGHGCNGVGVASTIPPPPPLVSIPENLFRFSILAKDSLIIDTTLGTDGKIGFNVKYGNGLIANPLDSIIDSIASQSTLFSEVNAFQSQLNSLTPICINCPISSAITPGVRNITGDLWYQEPWCSMANGTISLSGMYLETSYLSREQKFFTKITIQHILFGMLVEILK
jgi:hypothetical protein